jgi:hypothetical protein
MVADGWAYQHVPPHSRLVWSCWNYITQTTVNEQGVKKADDPQVSM